MLSVISSRHTLKNEQLESLAGSLRCGASRDPKRCHAETLMRLANDASGSA